MATNSPLKRVSAHTEATVTEIAEREGRTFIAQLDRIVAAGLQATGERVPDALKPAATATARKPRRQPQGKPDPALATAG